MRTPELVELSPSSLMGGLHNCLFAYMALMCKLSMYPNYIPMCSTGKVLLNWRNIRDVKRRIVMHANVDCFEQANSGVGIGRRLSHTIRKTFGKWFFAIDTNVFFEFHPTYCVVKDIQTREILLKGHIRDGLYYFSLPVASTQPVEATSLANISLRARYDNCDNFTLWHMRIDHPSASKGKSHKLPFSNSTIEYNTSFDLVVSDLWGLALVVYGRNRYYGSFQLVKTQFGKRIKQFQSNWGGEYRASTSILAVQGIIHRLSCPQTSEQNRVVERKHQQIVDMSITLLAQGKSTYGLLGLCILLCCPHHQSSSYHGYSSQHKGYKCLISDGQIVISRHGVFDKQRFLSPSSTSEGSTSSFDHSLSSTYVPLVKPVSCPSVASLSAPPLESSPAPIVCPSPSVSNTPQAELGSDYEPYPLSNNDGILNPNTTASNTLSSLVISSSSVPHLPLSNTHTMVTRSKAGILSPRLCQLKLSSLLRLKKHFLPPNGVLLPKLSIMLSFVIWDLVSLPNNHKVIGCKWLFKLKKNPDGTVARRKARLVAKRCSQVPECDFKETFSPVVKPATIRIILSIAVSKGWQLLQVDVNNVFLNEDLDDKVFMQQPLGYVQYGSNGEPLVCRLKKALYDDIIITGSMSNCITSFVQQLNRDFSLKDMGDLHYFLGIKVTRSSTGCLHICQRKYIRDLLNGSFMTHAKSVYTPMVSLSTMFKDDGDRLPDLTEYRSLAGALQYIVLTRPDIAYTSVMLMLTEGWILMIANLQRATVCILVTHQFLGAPRNNKLFRDLRLRLSIRVLLQPLVSAVAVAANPVLHFKFKHVELDLFFVREKVDDGSIVIGEVPVCDQVAGILTKPLSISFFTRFRSLLRVLPIGKMGEC
ncbi:hypothetical protein CXB51_018978 [Gossypium anomalum]|uniref:Reverse transcriptase Ty1/copia-type domain-containing protein n=1 Tax=Gossypium anomalum TaxID=47600 RepID=A0A8J5YVG2_9ROSI|nr:hypothetical protein CXB51_018978 [Gossypium anomalum]